MYKQISEDIKEDYYQHNFPNDRSKVRCLVSA